MRKTLFVLFAASLLAASMPVRSRAGESRANSADWILYGVLGFGLYELFKPHHHPSQSPTPVGTTPEVKACAPKITEGWFEPSQGVWQDDMVFQDHPTKQLTRTDVDGPPAYHAELAMITQRDTRFFGAKQYERNNQPVLTGGYYGIIHMAGTTDCDGPAKPIRMRFTVASGPHAQVVYTSPISWHIPLTGKHVAEQEWHTDFNASDGVPRYPEPPYRFTSSGPYTITDELVTPEGPTGLKVTVTGTAHSTVLLRVGFLAVFLRHHSGLEATVTAGSVSDVGVIKTVRRLARESQTFIPDYYPLRTNGWISRLYPHDLDLSAEPYVNATIAPASPPERTETQVSNDKWAQRERIEAAIAKELDLDTLMGGYDRMVAVLHPEDMNFISPGSAGSAFSRKVVMVAGDSSADFLDVAHEIAHTLPWIWSRYEMKQQCTTPGNYHNTLEQIASGMRLDEGGKPTYPDFLYIKVPFMGAARKIDAQWIDQCTYWHLADELRNKPDPSTLLVRGGIGKLGSKIDAALWPAYLLSGVVSIPNVSSPWSIVIRDGAGKIAAKYPFAPQFVDENGRPKDFAPFVFQIPRPASLGSIELRGPGVSVLHKAGRFAPKVTITEARVEGSRLSLRWQPKGDPAMPALSSVFVSDDGGITYNAWLTEQAKTSFAFPISHGKHRVKIVVTDGTRSAQAFADVRR